MPSTAIFLRARAEIKMCFASLRATQKFGEHEQASTRLNFASKSSKGKILRATKNFNLPFITPGKEPYVQESTALRGSFPICMVAGFYPPTQNCRTALYSVLIST